MNGVPMANNNEVPVFVRIRGDVKDFGEKLGKVQKDVKKWTGEVESAGVSAGASFGVFGAALTALSAKTVQTYANFEQLQARLEAVTHSSEKATQVFNQAVQLASATPFSVNQVTQAAVTMTAFRLNAQQTVPVVADLAAAMGKDIGETAVMMGKAMQGSSEGFQSLHEQAGITTMDLKKFGATVDAQGKLVLEGSYNVDKAREALIAYAGRRFRRG